MYVNIEDGYCGLDPFQDKPKKVAVFHATMLDGYPEEIRICKECLSEALNEFNRIEKNRIEKNK